MGNKFIETPPKTTGDITATLERFKRDLFLKVFFAGCNKEWDKSKLYVKSEWTPENIDIPCWAHDRLRSFSLEVSSLFKKKQAKSNLLPFQQQIMQDVEHSSHLLFPDTDKGLGPCAVEFEQYVWDCLVHLLNEKVYRQLSEEEATMALDELATQIDDWLEKYKHILPKSVPKFIHSHMKDNASSPYGQFYILYKIHKGVKDNGCWPTRPVCSDVSSLPHSLGKWVTEMLQPLAQEQLSYFKDSFALKDLLDDITVPANGLLFTSDATSMYTEIKTEPALEEITNYIRARRKGKIWDALIEALGIVFRNNIFRFGDTTWRQISGTGMGISPAPPWATLFYALHEAELVPKWAKYVSFYKRFIDDVIGIWLSDPDPNLNEAMWSAFKADMNKWYGLEWTCTTPALNCNFMDLTISITDGKLSTTLFEKEQNLHLYLPPTSSHPKGCGTGLVFGYVLRARWLCSNQADADAKIEEFLGQLLERGHSRENLDPLFARAEANAATYMSRSPRQRFSLIEEKKQASKQQLCFHLRFHREDPSSSAIQRLWREHIFDPEGKVSLPLMHNYEGEQIGVNKLIVAYSQPLNLRNKFSVRNIHGRGRPVSEYLAG